MQGVKTQRSPQMAFDFEPEKAIARRESFLEYQEKITPKEEYKEGDIKKGRVIGSKNRGGDFRLSACEYCGELRWVDLKQWERGFLHRCNKCNWKGKPGAGPKASEQKFEWTPDILDVKSGVELGKKKRGKHVLVACPQCKEARWIIWSQYRRNPTALCSHCGPRKTCQDRKGKYYGRKPTITVDGYVWAWLPPDDPLRCMAHEDGYVLEYRLLMAREIGRPLTDEEEVHHWGDKKDNRLEILRLVSPDEHRDYTVMCKRCPAHLDCSKSHANMLALQAFIAHLLTIIANGVSL